MRWQFCIKHSCRLPCDECCPKVPWAKDPITGQLFHSREQIGSPSIPHLLRCHPPRLLGWVFDKVYPIERCMPLEENNESTTPAPRLLDLATERLIQSTWDFHLLPALKQLFLAKPIYPRLLYGWSWRFLQMSDQVYQRYQLTPKDLPPWAQYLNQSPRFEYWNTYKDGHTRETTLRIGASYAIGGIWSL